MAQVHAAVSIQVWHAEQITDALKVGDAAARQLLTELVAGEYLICWTDQWLPLSEIEPEGRRRQQALLIALVDAYKRLQWSSSAADRFLSTDLGFLAEKVRRGGVQVCSRRRVDVAREAEAAHRRALDLQRWQREAEASIAAAVN